MTKRVSADRFTAGVCRLPGVWAVEAASTRSFSRHTHDQFGIGVVLRGAQDSASGRGQVRAVPGDLIAVNPNEVHDGRPVAGEPRAWRMLYFDAALIARLSVEMGRSPGGEFAHPVLDHGPATQVFMRLYAALTGPAQEPWQEIAEQELFQILAPLWGDTPPPQEGSSSKGIARAKVRIDASPEIPVTLAELAADAGLSRYHFLRAFKTATDLPPHAYRLQRQLQMARRLIFSGHSLAQATTMAGFADQSHLTRHFVQTYGLTPGSLATAIRVGA
ncbi:MULTISPECIES: AraC family transcriptional regulator [Ralstonia solanacearum species complex]|uniref:AraC family transcriptional regulator n=1 Tax=Ralstonia solanacearum species complex TaxID=3116862 RepID=UPI000E58EA8A|nr:AraC family transcriptional regulator [Ralstonia solanacearum]BEU74199.1 AraC family transcriptional regulator [Ralstonia pseudosolanacearum]AXV79088.1 transcriptional regulator [Ralstonia solanacearum]AXV93108.1 transcriptional regulator [Ralstonia solanacearum]AXW22016.1 transcriptional regulator [Ralstonia solanacearum]AXW64787.1 transcriptional regulator [Ralstonia solanacearum]